MSRGEADSIFCRSRPVVAKWWNTRWGQVLISLDPITHLSDIGGRDSATGRDFVRNLRTLGNVALISSHTRLGMLHSSPTRSWSEPSYGSLLPSPLRHRLEIVS